MSNDPNRGVTFEDLQNLEHRMDAKLDAVKDSLIEHMRDMQTELLRGYSEFARSSDLRMRKIEADTSNINESTTRRLASLEMQVHEIRVKIALDPPSAA